MSKKNGKLQCPFCFVIRSGMLSLIMHVSIIHVDRQYQFLQQINDGKIISQENSKRMLHKDRRQIVPMANRLGIQIRYKKTSITNYKMPTEFHFVNMN